MTSPARQNQFGPGLSPNSITKKEKENFSSEPIKNNQYFYSNSRVYPTRKHGKGIWGNPRVPMTVRIDKELKKQFKAFSVRVFGSTCLPLECVMASLLRSSIELEKTGVYPTHTVNINFEKIKIERNFRPRRSLSLQDFGFENWERQKRQKKRQNEIELLEKIYRGVLEQFETLKPRSQRFHLRRAQKIADRVPSAKTLLERFGGEKEFVMCR